MTITLSLPTDQPSKFSRIPWWPRGVHGQSRPLAGGTLAVLARDLAPAGVAPSMESAKRSEP
jgi:hypothetical protein